MLACLAADDGWIRNYPIHADRLVLRPFRTVKRGNLWINARSIGAEAVAISIGQGLKGKWAERSPLEQSRPSSCGALGRPAVMRSALPIVRSNALEIATDDNLYGGENAATATTSAGFPRHLAAWIGLLMTAVSSQLNSRLFEAGRIEFRLVLRKTRNHAAGF